MILSLIGMSSAGKTHWSHELQRNGYTRITCDELIERKLEPELRRHGYQGLNDVARWMGHPFDPQYPKTSTTYLSFEVEVMEEIFSDIEQLRGKSSKIVIDTTGSVIYTTPSVLHQLKEHTTIIYLDIPQEKKQELYQEFLRNPKPIIWGDLYRKREEESQEQALARCYLELLTYRSKQYEKIADITIPFDIHRQEGFTAADFVHHIATL